LRAGLVWTRAARHVPHYPLSAACAYPLSEKKHSCRSITGRRCASNLTTIYTSIRYGPCAERPFCHALPALLHFLATYAVSCHRSLLATYFLILSLCGCDDRQVHRATNAAGHPTASKTDKQLPRHAFRYFLGRMYDHRRMPDQPGNYLVESLRITCTNRPYRSALPCCTVDSTAFPS
jgi:hypothetical protein